MLLPWLTWKLVRRVVTFLVVAALAYYLVTVFQVWRAAESDDTRHSQALIVLGAAQYNGRPSPVYRARLDHAADLYRRGVAPVVVVTGGKQPGDQFTEAGAGADYLHTKGVPDTAILRETTGRSSWESLAASARFLQSRGIRRVVLVSDPFHSLAHPAHRVRARLRRGDLADPHQPDRRVRRMEAVLRRGPTRRRRAHLRLRAPGPGLGGRGRP